MYYSKHNDDLGVSFALDGELVGAAQEADTDKGYVKLLEYNSDSNDYILITKTGKVDFIGHAFKESPEVLRDRLNKIRIELGLDPYPAPLFTD